VVRTTADRGQQVTQQGTYFQYPKSSESDLTDQAGPAATLDQESARKLASHCFRRILLLIYPARDLGIDNREG
jgi:hypothetical protein